MSDANEHGESKRAGVALCLSGGGYRAMLFHAGALLRLNELGVLPKLDYVSGVSGGSIAAGVLGAHWGELQFDAQGVAANFRSVVIERLLRAARRTLDVSAVARALLPGQTAAGAVAETYMADADFLGMRMLSELPARPRFEFNATNLQSGARWWFGRERMGDYQIGSVAWRVPGGDADLPPCGVTIATAVTASGAFPPVLSPLTLSLGAAAWREPRLSALPPEVRLQLRKRVNLADGGVYDNHGLEEAVDGYQVLLVSDGGMDLGPEPDIGARVAAGVVISFQIMRVLNVIDSQVRKLRRRDLVGRLSNFWLPAKDPHYARAGTYWKMEADHRDIPGKPGVPGAPPFVSDGLPVDGGVADALARTSTRLVRVEDGLAWQWINLGYAKCDVRARTYCADLVRPGAPAPAWPDPEQRLDRGLEAPAAAATASPVVISWAWVLIVLLLLVAVAWPAAVVLGVIGVIIAVRTLSQPAAALTLKPLGSQSQEVVP